jgi:hypothetical protein
MPDNALCSALLDNVLEQIERTNHLMGLVPESQLEWTPAPGACSTGELLAHLLECMAGFCAVLAAAEPQRLAHFARLRGHPAPGIAIYRSHIEEGFALLTDYDLARHIPTVFVARGEPLLTLLLGNLEHLINHKHQLFTYLRQMGIPVATPDLYKFRR